MYEREAIETFFAMYSTEDDEFVNSPSYPYKPMRKTLVNAKNVKGLIKTLTKYGCIPEESAASFDSSRLFWGRTAFDMFKELLRKEDEKHHTDASGTVSTDGDSATL